MNQPHRSIEIWDRMAPEPWVTATIGGSRRRKTGSGVLRALSTMRSSVDRIGMSKRDATLKRIAYYALEQNRVINENHRISKGDYTASDYVSEENSHISAFTDLVQKGEINWRREKETDLLSTTFDAPVCASGGEIRYYFNHKVEDMPDHNHTASMLLRRSDNMILASTRLKNVEPFSIYHPRQVYKYNELLFIDTVSHHFRFFKSSGIDRTPMSYRILRATLKNTSNQASFNIGTMPAPEIFPQSRASDGEIED